MVSDSKKICSYVFTAILALAFVLLLAAYIVLPIISFLALLITSAIMLVIVAPKFFKKRPSLFAASLTCLIILTVNALCWSIFFPPLKISTKWQYPIALSYVFGSPSKSKLLPKELPESAEDVRFEFMPSFLQGTGHVSVGFTADDGYIQNLKVKLAKESMHITEHSELGELNDSLPSEDSDYGGYKYISLWEGNIRDEHPDATIYILYTNYNWNHPSSKAVFIDGNYVFFSEE